MWQMQTESQVEMVEGRRAMGQSTEGARQHMLSPSERGRRGEEVMRYLVLNAQVLGTTLLHRRADESEEREEHDTHRPYHSPPQAAHTPNASTATTEHSGNEDLSTERHN